MAEALATSNKWLEGKEENLVKIIHAMRDNRIKTWSAAIELVK